jgi:glucose-1-phosphate thymidylyltransferase
MKAIIPAAGIGKRLRPLTNTLPKILLNVAGKPMISYVIDDLLEIKEIEKVYLIIGYLKEKVERFVNEAYPSRLDRITLVEQKETLGLGHAIYQMKNKVGNEPLLIVLGDTVFEFDFRKFISLGHSALGVKKITDPTRYGIAEIKDGFISRMVEKPQPDETTSRDAIGGTYLVKNARNLMDALDYTISHNIRTKNEFQVTDALQHMIELGEKFMAYPIKNWFDCGNPESLLATNQYLLHNKADGANTKVYPDSIINAPCYLGNECVIKESEVGPYVTVERKAAIRNSQVANSIIHSHSVIENAILDNCIIGPGVKVTGEHKDYYVA